MANNFTSYANKSIGTSPDTIVTVGASTQTTIIGLSCANISTTSAYVDVYLSRGGFNYYLIKSALVPVGGSLVVVGGDQKVVLTDSDTLKVVSSVASSIDVITSVLNIT